MATDLTPAGDQPQAIDKLASWIDDGVEHCTLLGVTGSGKTYTMAKIIERLQRPSLILAPNKTLAAQLYGEFKSFFPNNAVEYFVSYYDYYQPEAYVPNSDTYIEKEATINDAIDRMRNSATRSLMDRRDVLIVASISCIYGLGSPDNYKSLSVQIKKGDVVERDTILRRLAQIQYRRDNYDFQPGRFRVRGDVLEVFPVYEDDRAIRVEMWGDEVESLYYVDPLRGEILSEPGEVTVYPTSHYVTPQDRLQAACASIEEELEGVLTELEEKKKLLERQRLQQRTEHDLEMLRATGMCNGIENYSRHLDGRAAGMPPATLIHYFPDDFLLFMDESHMGVPQAGGMYHGDRNRKQTLVNYGFRLPSAIDNRPLAFEEFKSLQNQVVYVSATPSDYELEHSGDRVAELVVRPTGLLDPPVDIRPARGQVDDLVAEVKSVAAKGARILVTTLTKRMAEELTDYLRDIGIKVRYLHSDIDSLERMALVRDLRLGVFDCLVGINLLREGLDIPEVELVAVLDADREGFLRNRTSLIQTCGRAARNAESRVLLYADKETDSIRAAVGEMERRRTKQMAYNEEHGITPRTVQKEVRELIEILAGAVDDGDDESSGRGKKGRKRKPRQAPADSGDNVAEAKANAMAGTGTRQFKDRRSVHDHVRKLREQMTAAAKDLDFELAAQIRDEIYRLEKLELELR